MCLLLKRSPYYQGSQFKMHFVRIMPVFRLTLFFLYQASCSGALVKFFTKLQNSTLVQIGNVADNKLKEAQMAELAPDRVENNVGKGENAGYFFSY